MITVTITKANGGIYLVQNFSTNAAYNTYLPTLKAMPSWSSTNIVTITGTDDIPAVETPPVPPTAQQLAIRAGLKAQGVGAQVVALVYSINEANVSAGTLTSGQFAAMLADTNLSNIERLLWNGSLQTALTMIRALDNTYFSSANLSAIETFIVASGLAT